MWAPEKAGVRQPLLFLMGTPENIAAAQHLHPHFGPREGKGEVATFDFVPLFWDTQERKGYVPRPP